MKKNFLRKKKNKKLKKKILKQRYSKNSRKKFVSQAKWVKGNSAITYIPTIVHHDAPLGAYRFIGNMQDKEGKNFYLIENQLQQGWNCFDRACILENILDIEQEELKNIDNAQRASKIRAKLVSKVLEYKDNQEVCTLLAPEIVQASDENSSSLDLPENLKTIFKNIETSYNGELENKKKEIQGIIPEASEADIQSDAINAIGYLSERKMNEARKTNIFEMYLRGYYGARKFAGFSRGDQSSLVDVLAYIYPHHRFITYENQNGLLKKIHDTNDNKIVQRVIGKNPQRQEFQTIHHLYHVGMHFQTLIPMH